MKRKQMETGRLSLVLQEPPAAFGRKSPTKRGLAARLEEKALDHGGTVRAEQDGPQARNF